MINRSIRALLLAAGYGSRLRPLTLSTPKCLVNIKGRPLLEHWLIKLNKLPSEKVLINTHYLNTQVDNFLKDCNFKKLEIMKTYEKQLLGTAGTFIRNIKFFSGSIGMLIHADNYTEVDLNELINAHINKPKECLITMLTFNTDNPRSCGIVEVNHENIVIKLHEKIDNPPGNRANGAIYIFDDIFTEWISRNYPYAKDFTNDILPRLLGRIYTWHTNEPYLDIGTKESLKKAQSI